MLCYCYGSVSDQLGPSAFNKFDLIWLWYYKRRPGSCNDPRDPSRSVGDFLRMPRQHCSPDAWNCVMQ